MKNIKYLDIINKFKLESIEVNSNLQMDITFENLKSLLEANTNDLTFFSNVKYIDYLKSCNAKACIISDRYSEYLPKSCTAIIVSDPYFAFACITDLFNDNMHISNGNISKNSFISNDTILESDVQIDDFCYIDQNTKISNNVIIKSNTRIGPNVIIKNNCLIHDNVSISNAIINENCEIKPGARIGFSGFGFEEKTKKKITHIGNVVIEKNSTIGSNTTIDRAVLESTLIGEYSQIDNLVQVAHNVIIGKHAIIAAQVGIAGSTVIGDNVKIGGQAGISGHLYIGKNVTIAGKSGVTKNIKDNSVVAGFPAKDINKWKREIIKLSK